MIHGNTARVASGCTCNLCTLVREVATARKSPSVPTGELQAHILALYAAGWTSRSLAAHAGYDRRTIRGIADGRTLWTSRLIAEDLLSIPVAAPAGRAA